MLDNFMEVKSYWKRGQELKGESGSVSKFSRSHGVSLHVEAF